MHVVGDERFWEPFPPAQHLNEITDRKDANRAIAVSALGLALTGLIELLIAVLSGSVGLLGDAIHNLSDVSTSLISACFTEYTVNRYSLRFSNNAGFAL